MILAGFVRLRFGLDISDEGLYFSAPFRIIMGDFRNTFIDTTVGRWFDLILWPVMKLLPGYGSILQIRYFGYALHILAIGSLFFSARRLVSPLLLAAFFAAAFHTNVYSIWTPSYIDLPVSFICISLSCFIESRRHGAGIGSVFLGIIAGACYFLAVICYAPTILLMSIPGLIFLVVLFKKNLRFQNSSICLYGTLASFSALFAGFVLFLSKSGYLDDVLSTIKFLRSTTEYGGTTSRIQSLIGQILSSAPAAAVIFAIFILLLLGRNKFRGGDRRTGGLFIALAGCAFMFHLIFSLPSILEGTIAAIAAAYVISRISAADAADKLLPVLDAIALFSLAWYGLVGLVSVGGIFTATYVIPPFFLILAFISEKYFSPASGSRRFLRFSVAALIILMAANVTLRSFYHSFMNPPVLKQTEKATRGRLNGIYASPQRVRDIEELLDYLGDRVKPGDFLLSFDHFSLLYYLTDTRPAMRTCFVQKGWTPPMLQVYVDEMVEKGRVPEYAVRLLVWPRNLEDLGTATRMEYSTDPGIDPVFSFVQRNYVLEKTIGPYEVWKLAAD